MPCPVVARSSIRGWTYWSWPTSARTRCPIVPSWCRATPASKSAPWIAAQASPGSPVMGFRWAICTPGTGWSCPRPAPRSPCSIRPATIISACCAPSSTGAAAKRRRSAEAVLRHLQIRDLAIIGADGRSRAWLNGQSVPVTVLRTVGELLFDIHGQHEFQSLMRSAAQRELLDSFGQLDALAGQVRAAHASWLALMNRSVTVEAAASDRHARLDLLRYQVQELDAMQLGEAEFAALIEERSRIANSGRLAQAARSALEGLYESEEGNAHQLLARASGALRGGGSVDARLVALQQPLEEALVRIQEVAHELGAYLESLEFDPKRQEVIEARLATMEELARKHRVEPADLVAWHGALRRELAGMENAAADLGSLRAQVAAALTAYQTQARDLSAARSRAARGLGIEVTRRMQDLGMAVGVFIAEVSPLESTQAAAHGADRVEFRVSTNPGHAPRAVAKIASGGELARLSLAVQVCCAPDAAPCMVFDEVDAGIGGATAAIFGRGFGGPGRGSQVLCGTHLAPSAFQSPPPLTGCQIVDERYNPNSGAATSRAARTHG